MILRKTMIVLTCLILLTTTAVFAQDYLDLVERAVNGLNNDKYQQADQERDIIVTEDSTFWIWQPDQTIEEEDVEIVCNILACKGIPFQGGRDYREIFSGSMKGPSITFFNLLTDIESGSPNYPVYHVTPCLDSGMFHLKKGNLEHGGKTALPIPYTLKDIDVENISPEFGEVVKGNNESEYIAMLYMFSIYINEDNKYFQLRGLFDIIQIQILNDGKYKFSPNTFTLGPYSALINGKMCYPQSEWSLVGPNIYIKGGGLEFGPNGIKLISGTKVKMKVDDQ